MICPLAALVCVCPVESISPADLLTEAGAAPWEVTAWEAIRSGSLGKGSRDLLPEPGGEGVLVGHYHLHYSPGERLLGLGTTDPLVALAVLYGDPVTSYRVQLAEWRRKVAPAVSEARRHGLRGWALAVVGAVANTSPQLAIRLGRATGWRPERMLDRYATTAHRMRRAGALRGAR